MAGDPGRPDLGPRARAAGYRLAAFDSIDSTNTEALRRGRAGEAGRLWCFSDDQTAGRGRRGRAWIAPRGNMAASLLVVTDLPAGTAATLGFVAGLALDQALSEVLPAAPGGLGRDGDRRLSLKWPNDVLHGDRKLAGILLEAEPLGQGRLAVAVGIGVNVVAAPEGLPYPATALAALGAAETAAGLLRRLAEAWVGIEAVWAGGRGLEPIRRAWLEKARGLGEPVAIRNGGDVLSGVFETIDAEGRLVVRTETGTRHAVAAGDVHFGAVATAAPEG